MASESALHGLSNSLIFARILRKQKNVNHHVLFQQRAFISENLGAQVIYKLVKFL